MNDTTDRLCGRVDGAIVCESECWRHVALGDEACPPPSLPRRRNQRGSLGSNLIVLVNVLCAIAIIAFALVLLAGWFNFADAAHKRPGHGKCRAATYCKPPKVRPTTSTTPTAQPTPIAPGCVEYGPDCVIDLTTGWPTVGPVVIVQTFPCPLSPLDDPEPCEPVTSTTTVAP